MSRWLALLALATLGGLPCGCAASARDSAAMRRVASRRADGDDTPRDVPEESEIPRAKTLHDAPAGTLNEHDFAATSETKVIGDAPARERARPRRRKPIDVNLQRAKTAEALQFLADAGGFNLVLQGDLAAPVTVSLHQVDPFDALTAIAESQHLGVEVGRDIVIVGAEKTPH